MGEWIKQLSTEKKMILTSQILCGIGVIILGIAAKNILSIVLGFMIGMHVLNEVLIEGLERQIKLYAKLCDKQHEIISKMTEITDEEVERIVQECIKEVKEEKE